MRRSSARPPTYPLPSSWRAALKSPARLRSSASPIGKVGDLRLLAADEPVFLAHPCPRWHHLADPLSPACEDIDGRRKSPWLPGGAVNRRLLAGGQLFVGRPDLSPG